MEDYLRIIRFIRFKIMYDIKVEPTTSSAIKQNLDGIKRISKERILVELLKILKMKNILNINESGDLSEIFSMIFPEFLYLKRLDRLKKIYDFSDLNRDIFLAVLLIDENDNHEYFLHKYNISNEIKETLRQLGKNLKRLHHNKEFFGKDFKKNIYINGKNHLSFKFVKLCCKSKVKIRRFSKISKNIKNQNT